VTAALRTFVSAHGKTIADYPDLLTQVRVGNDFYLGQVPYVVKEIATDPDGNLIIYVERKLAT
jgi:hypothetical protein